MPVTTFARWMACLGLGLAVAACDDGGSGSPGGRGDAGGDAGAAGDVADGAAADGGAETASPGPDEARLQGRIQRAGGEPIAGQGKVLFCGDRNCLFLDTDDEGGFRRTGVDIVDPRRFEVVGRYDDYGTVVFRRDAEPGSVLDVGTVTAPEPVGEPAAVSADEGGTVTLAGGQLELTFEPGELTYPIGHAQKELQAAPIPMDELPPWSNRPWEGVEDRSLAFSLIPFEIHTAVEGGPSPKAQGKAETPSECGEPDEGGGDEAPDGEGADGFVEMRVLEGLNAEPGTSYGVYTVNTYEGCLVRRGTVEVDEEGRLDVGPEHGIQSFTHVVFAPDE